MALGADAVKGRLQGQEACSGPGCGTHIIGSECVHVCKSLPEGSKSSPCGGPTEKRGQGELLTPLLATLTAQTPLVAIALLVHMHLALGSHGW